MRYRRLTKEEFEALHEDFIYFLAANTITGDDWVKIKEETPDKAEQLLDMFSDIAWEKVLENTNYVERIGEKEWMCASFGEKDAHMVVLRSKGGEALPNMLEANEIRDGIKGGSLELLQGNKTYAKLKEQEVFELIQQGGKPSKGENYKKIKSVLS